jgi:hypothetical protein
LAPTPPTPRTLSAHLGTVTITDTRGVVDGAWTASVSATRFSAAQRSPNQQLPRSSIASWSGPVLSETGTATLAPGQAGPGQAVLLTRTPAAFSATALTGDNTALEPDRHHPDSPHGGRRPLPRRDRSLGGFDVVSLPLLGERRLTHQHTGEWAAAEVFLGCRVVSASWSYRQF